METSHFAFLNHTVNCFVYIGRESGHEESALEQIAPIHQCTNSHTLSQFAYERARRRRVTPISDAPCLARVAEKGVRLRTQSFGVRAEGATIAAPTRLIKHGARQATVSWANIPLGWCRVANKPAGVPHFTVAANTVLADCMG